MKQLVIIYILITLAFHVFRTVAENLKKGSSVKPESFGQATVFFSDVVGFTAMAAESLPMQVRFVVRKIKVALIHHSQI